MTPQTPFRIASLRKQLTGLAVRQLIDDGRLDFATTVSDCIRPDAADDPRCPPPEERTGTRLTATARR
jgi:CubicO group peptidase (beta-lactamase class C family)